MLHEREAPAPVAGFRRLDRAHDVCLAKRILPEDRLNRALDAYRMTKPGLPD